MWRSRPAYARTPDCDVRALFYRIGAGGVFRADGLPDGVLSHPPRQHEQGGRFAACARRIPFCGGFEGEIPGAKKIECGNYLEHDLTGAKQEAAAYCGVLSRCSEATMVYPD